mmetsp:Transcript_28644/g.87696  ORF Transcript_28644/g.87696 Transcript_28644/m.87696 type:complete len:472 (-) Transcript_28644:860-2275(-)
MNAPCIERLLQKKTRRKLTFVPEQVPGREEGAKKVPGRPAPRSLGGSVLRESRRVQQPRAGDGVVELRSRGRHDAETVPRPRRASSRLAARVHEPEHRERGVGLRDGGRACAGALRHHCRGRGDENRRPERPDVGEHRVGLHQNESARARTLRGHRPRVDGARRGVPVPRLRECLVGHGQVRHAERRPLRSRRRRDRQGPVCFELAGPREHRVGVRDGRLRSAGALRSGCAGTRPAAPAVPVAASPRERGLGVRRSSDRSARPLRCGCCASFFLRLHRGSERRDRRSGGHGVFEGEDGRLARRAVRRSGSESSRLHHQLQVGSSDEVSDGLRASASFRGRTSAGGPVLENKDARCADHRPLFGDGRDGHLARLRRALPRRAAVFCDRGRRTQTPRGLHDGGTRFLSRRLLEEFDLRAGLLRRRRRRARDPPRLRRSAAPGGPGLGLRRGRAHRGRRAVCGHDPRGTARARR